LRRRPDEKSMSGVRGARLGGVDEMKREMGFEDGWTCGSEPVEEGFSVYACSADVEGLPRSFDNAFVWETFGGTSAT
jgi:hypothetical protein